MHFLYTYIIKQKWTFEKSRLVYQFIPKGYISALYLLKPLHMKLCWNMRELLAIHMEILFSAHCLVQFSVKCLGFQS